MSEERRKILEMVAAGKVSVDEAERLLKALGEESQSEKKDSKSSKNPKYLRVEVEPAPGNTDGDRVNVRVPMNLIRAGLKWAAVLPKHARGKVDEALKDQGFGVLTEIDVKDTLRRKLEVDFRKYVILGACNPPLAHRALSEELEIGLLLPCNVIVYENEGGGSTVSVINAEQMLSAVGREDLKGLAGEVNEKLKKALENV